MGAKRDDISEIRKYLSGELNAGAMHRLERRAQDDPFLMDALEGYSNRKDQQPNLEDMHARLHKRIHRKSKKIVSLWPLISVAASILVFITLGAWWVMFYKPSVQKNPSAHFKRATAIRSLPNEEKAPEITLEHRATLSAPGSAPPPKPDLIAEKIDKLSGKPLTQNGPVSSIVVKSQVNSIAAVKLPDTFRRNPQLAGVNVTGYATQRKKDVTNAVITVPPANTDGIAYKAVAPAADPKAVSPAVIEGQVIGADDNHPIQGAAVRITGTKTATVTDGYGKFRLATTRDQTLEFAYTGYKTQQLNISGGDVRVRLQPANNSLAEVGVSNPPAKIAARPGTALPANDDNEVVTSNIVISKENGFRHITGQVRALLGEAVIKQAIILNRNTDRQYATDNSGNYILDARTGDDLYVGFRGFKNQKIKVGKKDVINITLEEKVPTFYDTFTQGLNFTPYDDKAHPAIGWDKFREHQYSAKSPDGSTGSVRVKFTVNVDNSISGITVVDSLNVATNAEAVRIITQQTKWLHNTNNKPETLTLRIKFTK